MSIKCPSLPLLVDFSLLNMVREFLVSRDALLIFTHPGACMQPMELHLCPQPLKVYCNSQYAVLAVWHQETVQITSSGTSIHNLLQSV